jgi:uncharacterized protein YaaQ
MGMKLVIAMIQDEDASNVIHVMNEHHIQVTRLATKGGFLRAGNTTILVGVEEEQVKEVIGILEASCKSRMQFATLPTPGGAMHGFIPKPIEVRVGGATIFVVDVEQFYKF